MWTSFYEGSEDPSPPFTEIDFHPYQKLFPSFFLSFFLCQRIRVEPVFFSMEVWWCSTSLHHHHLSDKAADMYWQILTSLLVQQLTVGKQVTLSVIQYTISGWKILPETSFFKLKQNEAHLPPKNQQMKGCNCARTIHATLNRHTTKETRVAYDNSTRHATIAGHINSTKETSSKKGVLRWPVHPPFHAHSTTRVCCVGLQQNQVFFKISFFSSMATLTSGFEDRTLFVSLLNV